MDTVSEKPKRDWLLPASILLSAVIVALALVYNVGKRAEAPSPAPVAGPSPENVRPIASDDHIRGNPAAPVKIIEFSDLECPFCKQFHKTLQQVVDRYGDRVVWVYRHYPISELHPKAPDEAQAAECAGALGGNEKFWAFVDRVFEVTPSNNGLDPAELPRIAERIGLKGTDFGRCLAEKKFTSRIGADMRDAENSRSDPARGVGTPYSIIITAKGQYYPVSGALPFDNPPAGVPSMVQIIEQALVN